MAVSSMFSHLYLALQQRLASVSGIRFVEQDLGQLMDEQPQLSYPAVLVDMSDFSFSAIGENVQTGEGIVKIRLVFKPLSDTNNLKPAQVRENGLRYYELENAIHLALQGWSPSYVFEDEEQIPQDIFGRFARMSARTNQSREDLRIREISYRIGFEDYSTKWQVLYAPALPIITTELQIPT